MDDSRQEYWLRGKVEGVPELLQPAAHALLQSRKEARVYSNNFPEELLWKKPAGRASVGFHLQHICGVIDRMLTYSKGEQLSNHQLLYLEKEGIPDQNITIEFLLNQLENKIEEVVEHLKILKNTDLSQEVEVGRKRIPSSVIGVLFHAAEHSQRHIGQMLVSISVLKSRTA